MEYALDVVGARVEVLREADTASRRRSTKSGAAADDDAAVAVEEEEGYLAAINGHITRFKLSLVGDNEEYLELSGYTTVQLEDENSAVPDPTDVEQIFRAVLRSVRLAGHDRELALIDILASLELLPSDLSFGMSCWTTATKAVRNVAKAQLMAEARSGGPPKQREMGYFAELLELRSKAQEFSRMAGGTDELAGRIAKQQAKITDLQAREKTKVAREVDRAVAEQRESYEQERRAADQMAQATALRVAALEADLKEAQRAAERAAASGGSSGGDRGRGDSRSASMVEVDPELVAKNWMRKVDKKSKKAYWGNTVTKKTMWKTPKCVKAAQKAAAESASAQGAAAADVQGGATQGSGSGGGADPVALAMAVERAEAAEAKAASAARKVGLANAELDAERASVEAQKARVAKAEQDAGHLRDRVDALEGDLKTAAKQRDEARATVAESDARLTSLKERMAQQMADMQRSSQSSAGSSAAAATAEIDALREKVGDLSGQLASAQARVDQVSFFTADILCEFLLTI